ncbi:XdhC family protein [Spirosoma endophyticum]|uniref:Xanthine dehydrogenase accessory factor n=1 Tax=Spirosoma endophyticum TaxID=662367 RepID=A0A1I1F0M4_9BACT|nr:XdhC/CoxI family protein [Spirosoma endophyticum]SFB92536.1 xanthine dehydrogenase accessory factor [Spirosoma endophyticum]
MIKPLKAWKLLADSLRQNLPVMLLYVLESHGSSPGRQGFLMAINASGDMEGSIGGGIMEHKFVEMAKEKLQRSAAELSIRTQYHDKSAAHNQSGMICSGDQTILIYRIQPSDTSAIQAIIRCLEQHKNGTLELSPAGINFIADQRPEVDFQFRMQSEQAWVYQEKIGYKNQLFIIGGGHCALALSEQMSRMDFYIRVFDDRPDLYTMSLNNVAHEKIVVTSYNELADLIPPGTSHYVVVMTFGYRTDDLAIRPLLNKKFAYLGVLGSRTKIDKLFAEYRAEGIPDETLRQLHAPIGLAINSQTPEEIAVSIAAEIIQVKNAG